MAGTGLARPADLSSAIRNLGVLAWCELDVVKGLGRLEASQRTSLTAAVVRVSLDAALTLGMILPLGFRSGQVCVRSAGSFREVSLVF